MSRFVTTRSEDARLDAMADPASLGGLDEDDPRSVAQFMRKMGREFGDELGDDFEETVDEAMAESGADDESERGASESDDAGDL